MVEFPTRLCEVKGELGYFHLWEQWSNVVGASLLRGGHHAGQIGQVLRTMPSGPSLKYPFRSTTSPLGRISWR